MTEEEGTTNRESGGNQSKKIDSVNVSLQSCRKIEWKIKIGILEGGIELLLISQTPWGGVFLKCTSVQRGAAAYELGNTSSRTITEVKQR